MVTATFRFYEELNDFLAPKRRKREFTVPCARAATTKHMIEALGVPHTEVELVLVNGESVGFDRLLGDGAGSLSSLFADLLARYNDGERYVLHFSTPWEMYRAVKVLEANDPSAIDAVERFQFSF